MRILFPLHRKILLLYFLFLIYPRDSFAAQILFSVVPNTVIGDTATIIEAYIHPEGEHLNVVEGTIYFNDTTSTITSVITETGGSVLTLWPIKPVFDSSAKRIHFTGGTRNSFDTDELLFRLRIFASSTEMVTVMWLGGNTYQSDGKGTAGKVSSRSLEVVVEKSIPNTINPSSHDSTSPDFDTVEIGSDGTMFDGKKFIGITATDDISGIDRIEVTEDGVVAEIQNDTYVLQNQDDDAQVLVTAYDKAGNSTSIKVPTSKKKILSFGISIVFLLLVIIMVFVKRKK